MDLESKEYSWKFVTGDELLALGECELIYAHLVVSAANGSADLYDGEDTTGLKITTMQSAAKTGMQFHPGKPVYCRRGLYVDIGSSVTGLFIQWRDLGHKGGRG